VEYYTLQGFFIFYNKLINEVGMQHEDFILSPILAQNEDEENPEDTDGDDDDEEDDDNNDNSDNNSW